MTNNARSSSGSTRLRAVYPYHPNPTFRKLYGGIALDLIIGATHFERVNAKVAADYLALAAVYKFRIGDQEGVTQCLERLTNVCPNYDFDRLRLSEIKENDPAGRVKTDFRGLSERIDFAPVTKQWDSMRPKLLQPETSQLEVL